MLIMYGMDACINCLEAKEVLAENKIEYEYRRISDSVLWMKEFLQYRDHDPKFEEVRNEGYIGIPCFVLEDGTITFDVRDLL